MDLHISMAAQEVFSIGGFSVTNALLTGAVASLVAILVLFYVGGKVKKGKYNRFVGLVQWVFEGLLNQIKDVVPDKKIAKSITPLAVTIFFVVLFNYWVSILPGVDTIKIGDVPLFRSMASDLNFTLGLALISIVAVQFYAVKHLGAFNNLHRYFRNPIKDPIGSFEGILELVGEVSRCMTLALRLFGNAFAGEVLLIVIAVLSSYAAVASLPIFMVFELFIGFIQAYVFFILTLIFTSLATSHGPSKDHSPAIDKKSEASAKT